MSKEGLLKGKDSTVDSLVVTSLLKIPLVYYILITFYTKQVTLMWWSTVLRFPVYSVFPGLSFKRASLLKVEISAELVQSLRKSL
jgi:hypothetical protein